MIELLSVHIPKTAGSSFLKVLKRIYGKQLIQMYRRYKPDVDYKKIVEDSSWAAAIHGHFNFTDFRDRYPDAKTITWLRDPIKRINSYYHYWLTRKPHGNPNHDKFMADQWDIIQLAEFLKHEVSEGYLTGYDLTEIDFVGVVEYIDEDMVRFHEWVRINKLGLSNVERGLFQSLMNSSLVKGLKRKTPHSNKNPQKKPLTLAEEEKLKIVLKPELDLYEKALTLRKQRAQLDSRPRNKLHNKG